MSELEELKLAYAECSRQRNELLNKLKSQAQQEPVAWRWLYNGQPDSEKHFSMPGPDAAVISRAAACEFPRTVQYLYTSPPAQRKPLTDEEARKLIKVGPVYAPDGVVTRSPIAYRKELEEAGLRGLRKGEAAHNIKENT